jgi:hypothetical protein
LVEFIGVAVVGAKNKALFPKTIGSGYEMKSAGFRPQTNLDKAG